MDYRPTIAITMGDPAGIGPEVIVKALADPVAAARARYIIYGMNELLAYAADLAEYDVFWWRDQYNGRLRAYPHDVVVVDYDQYSACSAARSAAPARWAAKRRCGSASTRSRPASKKLVDAVVTAPIAKESWKLAGYQLSRPHRTVRRAHRCHGDYAMMFAGGPLKVVLATVHMPLMGLWGRLNIGAVFQPIELLHQALVEWFDIPKPRIAVAGVNPHASENGQFGDEEERIIAPAILMAREQGIDVHRPVSARHGLPRSPRRPVRCGRRDVSRPGADPGEAAGVRPGGEHHARPADHPHQPGSRHGVRHRRPKPRQPRSACVRRSKWRSIWRQTTSIAARAATTSEAGMNRCPDGSGEDQLRELPKGIPDRIHLLGRGGRGDGRGRSDVVRFWRRIAPRNNARCWRCSVSPRWEPRSCSTSRCGAS